MEVKKIFPVEVPSTKWAVALKSEDHTLSAAHVNCDIIVRDNTLIVQKTLFYLNMPVIIDAVCFYTNYCTSITY